MYIDEKMKAAKIFCGIRKQPRFEASSVFGIKKLLEKQKRGLNAAKTTGHGTHSLKRVLRDITLRCG